MSDEIPHDEPEVAAPTSDPSNAGQPTADQPTADQPTADQPTARKTSRNPEPDEGWELWTKVAMLMGALGVIAWTIVLLRVGEPSVYVYSFVVPALATLSVPVTLWGLIKTVFNRPLFRRSRTIGFGLLLAVAFLGSTPYFPVPLSTEDFESSHTYRLPFDGEWAVTAGGESIETNYHATSPSYRFAYDFAPVVDGARQQGEGAELSDNYCYGEPVLAPTSGEVVRIKDGQEDNAIGATDIRIDSQSVMGNHVVIRVDDKEYLFISHMKEGSVSVDKGDQVVAGQKLGECGNSGGSRTPNVHVHLQNTKEFPIAESLPLFFSDYVADGKPVEKGMPQGSTDPESPFGQRVKNAKSNGN